MLKIQIDSVFLGFEDFLLLQRKIGEYETLEQGIQPDLSFSINGQVKSSYFELKRNYYEEKDYFLSADIDLKRMFHEEFYYFRMPHYLEHDPLKNLNAVFSQSGWGSSPSGK